VLSGHGDLPHADLAFEYFKPSHLIETAVTVVLGVLLAWWYVRRPEPRPVTLLRRLHTGSVNDYLGFATLGLIAAAATLMA
jgi:multicomponent Na+:H+ antiporter subunit D